MSVGEDPALTGAARVETVTMARVLGCRLIPGAARIGAAVITCPVVPIRPARERQVTVMDATDSAASTRLRASDKGSVNNRPVESERLRQLGIDCAAMIAADPDPWLDAARWLRTLPMCWAIVERHHGVDATSDQGDPWLVVGLDGMPVKTDETPAHQFYIYGNEAETNRIQGPILRRLMTAWNAASHRFLHQQRGHDRYFDFGLVDARRIVLLAALTLNRDFDGVVVGLDIPWEHPADCGASFEGRGWAWASLTSGLFTEPTMLELIDTSTDYLRRMPTGAPDPGIGYMREREASLDRATQAIKSIMPLGEQLREMIAGQSSGRPAVGSEDERTPIQPATGDTDWRDVQRRLLELYEQGERYTSIADLANRLGCSKATVHKAIKPPQSSLDGLNKADRAQANSAARKLAGWQARSSTGNGAPHAISLNDLITDSVAQAREANPATEAEGADWDVEFERLRNEAEPDERTRLDAMSEDRKRELMAELRKDPDRYDRVVGRKP